MNYCFQTKNAEYDYLLVYKKAMRLNLLISFGFFALVYFLANIESAIVTSLLLFVSQYFKISTRTKFFLLRIEINSDVVNIIYKEKGEVKELMGSRKEFQFKKGMSISKGRDPYLLVNYKGELVIKQYIDTDFDLKEKDLDDAIQAFQY